MALRAFMGRKCGKNVIGYLPHLSTCKRHVFHKSGGASNTTQLRKRARALPSAREELSYGKRFALL
jgi:hypothetical protein